MPVRRVFIVGPGRSGTSLLRAILNRHPDVAIAPETHFLDIWLPRLFPGGHIDKTRWREYTASRHFARLGINPDSIDTLQGPRTCFNTLIEAHCASVKGSPLVVGEKTPAHHHHIGTLLRWFPDAVILFCSRDPRGVVGSLRTLDEPWAEKSLVAGTRDWKQAMSSFWRYSGHPQVRLVPFEKLVAAPERQLRGILNIVGLDWRADLLEADAEPMRHSNESLLAPSPIDPSRMASWEGRLSPLEVATVECMTGHEMSRLGYTSRSRAAVRLIAGVLARIELAAVRIRNGVLLARNGDLRVRRRHSRGEML